MDMRPYVETIHRQLLVAAEGVGDEARAVAERLTAAVDSTVRLTLQDALVAAAEEITCELAPGSVELRLRGRDPEFVVRPPASTGAGVPGEGPHEAGAVEGLTGPGAAAGPATEPDDGGTARVNLRLPEQLKARAEQAAANERVSLNTWLVKAVASTLDRTAPPGRAAGPGPSRRQRYVGWTR